MGITQTTLWFKGEHVSCLILANLNFCPRRWDFPPGPLNLPEFCLQVDQWLTWNHTNHLSDWHVLLQPRGTSPIELDSVDTDAAFSHIVLSQDFGAMVYDFHLLSPAFLFTSSDFPVEHWVSTWPSVEWPHIWQIQSRKPPAFTSPTEDILWCLRMVCPWSCKCRCGPATLCHIPSHEAWSASSFLLTYLLWVILSLESWLVVVCTLIWLLILLFQQSANCFS